MRHLGSLLAGLFAAPALWLLLALGQPRTAATITRWVDHDTYKTVDLLGPVAYIVAAGLLLGLVACLRISPAGPLVAGLAYAALYGALFVDPLRVIDAIPKNADLGPVDAQLRVPVVNGTLALIAGCLLVALVSGGRWRRWPTAARPAEAEGFADPLATGPVSPGPVSPGSLPQSPTSPGLAPLGPVPPLPTRTPRQQTPATEQSAAPTTPVIPTSPTLSESPTVAARPEPAATRALSPTVRAGSEPPTTPVPSEPPAEPTVSLSADALAADSASQPSTAPPPWPPPADATATRVPAEADDATDLGPSEQAPQSGAQGTDEAPPASPWAVPPRTPRW